MTDDWKMGWVQNIEDDFVYCILTRDYEPDHELLFHINQLSSDQVDLLSLGQILKYNKKTEEIKFRENTEKIIWI